MKGMDRRGVLAVGAALPVTAALPASRPVSGASDGPARLSLNENAFGPSPRVARAITGALPDLARYADQADADRLAARVAAIEGVGPEQLLFGDLLTTLGQHLAARPPAGGRFIYSAPGYTALVDSARPLGAEGIGVPLDNELRDDLPALSQAIDGHTRALFLVRPHNPSGTAHPWDRFSDFLATASKRTLVIVDEAYLDYDGPRANAVALTRAGANVAVFRTFEKIHGLAALPLGYVVAPAPLAKALKADGIGAAHSLSRMALIAADAALDDPTWTGEVRRRTIAGRDRLHAVLDRLGIVRSASRANFIFFRSPIEAARLRARLAQSGILVGRAFPPLGEWVRITVGTEAEVDRTISALQQALVDHSQ